MRYAQFILFFIFGSAIFCFTSCSSRALVKAEVVTLLTEESEVTLNKNFPCSKPLTEHSILQAIGFLEKESNALKRLEQAKELVSSECFSIFQLLRMSRLFYKEQDVADFAVYAYPFCMHPESYFLFKQELALERNKQLIDDLID